MSDAGTFQPHWWCRKLRRHCPVGQGREDGTLIGPSEASRVIWHRLPRRSQTIRHSAGVPARIPPDPSKKRSKAFDGLPGTVRFWPPRRVSSETLTNKARPLRQLAVRPRKSLKRGASASYWQKALWPSIPAWHASGLRSVSCIH